GAGGQAGGAAALSADGAQARRAGCAGPSVRSRRGRSHAACATSGARTADAPRPGVAVRAVDVRHGRGARCDLAGPVGRRTPLGGLLRGGVGLRRPARPAPAGGARRLAGLARLPGAVEHRAAGDLRPVPPDPLRGQPGRDAAGWRRSAAGRDPRDQRRHRTGVRRGRGDERAPGRGPGEQPARPVRLRLGTGADRLGRRGRVPAGGRGCRRCREQRVGGPGRHRRVPVRHRGGRVRPDLVRGGHVQPRLGAGGPDHRAARARTPGRARPRRRPRRGDGRDGRRGRARSGRPPGAGDRGLRDVRHRRL
ncbi:MAG: hypothetical protein AVDCRST_MAG66-4664, partial [uncultured Pseudonocardia sp.]